MTDTHKADLGRRAAAATGIPGGSAIDRRLPAVARPYARLMRIDRPIGTWLLLFPCWWGLFLAADLALPWNTKSLLQLVYEPTVLFAIGAVVMRGAGCTYN